MSKSSYLGYYLRQDANAFRAKQPIDTSRAWTNVNNLAHLVDESPQHFINFAGNVSDSEKSWRVALVANTPFRFMRTYIHTWTLQDRPCSIDLLVYARTSAITSNVTLDVTIVPDIADPGYMGDGILYQNTGIAVTSSTATAVIDGTAVFDADPAWALMWQSYPYQDGSGNVTYGLVPVARLECVLTSDDDEPELEAEICAVQLRGYV